MDSKRRSCTYAAAAAADDEKVPSMLLPSRILPFAIPSLSSSLGIKDAPWILVTWTRPTSGYMNYCSCYLYVFLYFVSMFQAYKIFIFSLVVCAYVCVYMKVIKKLINLYSDM